MLKVSKRILKETPGCLKSCKQKFSIAADIKIQERHHTFRTHENDPSKHTKEHEGQFYTIPPNITKQIFFHGGLPKSFEIHTKTFNETVFMVRKPTLDIITCMKSIDYNKPAVKFVLYGKKGSGKSLSLAHILHYAFINEFLIIHVPWVGNWMRRCKESSNSETKPGFIDLNLDAAAWLLHFKTQNAHLLSKVQLQISRDYRWSKREITTRGTLLIEMIEHGITRIKYASETILALFNEIKELSKQNICKTLVAIDGFNAFFYPHTRVFTEKKEVVHPHKVTFSEAFLNLTKSDWNNAVSVLIVDELAIAEKDQISHLPRYLLGKQGFEHLDPFVPVLVNNYSEKELLSCLDYYRERRWIQSYPHQNEEIQFLSASNPYKLMKICAGL